MNLREILSDYDRLQIECMGYECEEQDKVEQWHEETYKEPFLESFRHNWSEFICEKAEDIDESELTFFFGTVYNTVLLCESIWSGYVYRKKNEIHPVFRPDTTFRSLRFDDGCFNILQGSLWHIPMQKGFYRLKTLGECVVYVFKDWQKWK